MASEIVINCVDARVRELCDKIADLKGHVIGLNGKIELHNEKIERWKRERDALEIFLDQERISRKKQ